MTQSGQLYNEANAMALGRVYCFRAYLPREKTKSAAISPSSGCRAGRWRTPIIDDVMNLAEGSSSPWWRACIEKRRRELTVLEREPRQSSNGAAPFPRISYDDAVARLQRRACRSRGGGDFGGPDETATLERIRVGR